MMARGHPRAPFLASINLHTEGRIHFTLSPLRISMVPARHKIISQNHYLWFTFSSWVFELIAMNKEKYETHVFYFSLQHPSFIEKSIRKISMTSLKRPHLMSQME
uniref:Uncharacterized protein n=1 Tax=Cacopsylla melanoneura TaxID=428564 RepID=A0A8D8VH75_9HEMI